MFQKTKFSSQHLSQMVIAIFSIQIEKEANERELSYRALQLKDD
jgi:hypothetical protein